MSMNVGAIMKALMGVAQPSDPRALELRIGQIVRGVLLQVTDGGEALLQINGVQVRAQLAADLPVGQSTLLQVQPPPAGGGQIVLKPLADASDPLDDAAMPDLAKSFGLPGQKWSFELLLGLKRDGYPIEQETAHWFKQAAEAKASGADAQEWMNAAGVAFRRGLAPTETTIASLRQALYGPPLHAQLEGLQKLLADYLGQAGGAEDAPMSGGAAAAARVSRLLAQGSALLAAGSEELLAAPGQAQTAAGAGTPADEAEALARGSAGFAAAAGEGSGDGARVSASDAQAPAGRASANADAVPADGGMGGRPAGANVAQTAAGAGAVAAQSGGLLTRAPGQAPTGPASAPAAQAGGVAEGAAQDAAGSAAARGATAGSDAGGHGASAAASDARAGASGAAAPRAEASWIGRFMQWLGVEHEHQAAVLPAGESGAGTDGKPNADGDPGQSSARAGDTLKSALLTLASSDSVPSQLREAAHALAQQITGQQLLLANDKTNPAPMSHMTFFVPFKGQDGDTTATIHVQTRKGRRGEWDTGNCRLLFDLRMSHLGDTVVDVQVVDKVVSLKLMNDRPWVAEILESARDEAAAGLRAAGFQLLSLKTVPFPVSVQADAGESAAAQPAGARIAAEAYAAKPYKGVDYRA